MIKARIEWKSGRIESRVLPDCFILIKPVEYIYISVLLAAYASHSPFFDYLNREHFSGKNYLTEIREVCSDS